MIRGLVIRPVEPADHDAVRALVADAFGQLAEAELVDALRRDGDVVLELIATCEQEPVGHVLFSRLNVEGDGPACAAVALAPIAVAPDRQHSGVGAALIENAHHMLEEAGETLSLVLGDTAYYPRFGYDHARAAGFESDYQCDALMAHAFADAPAGGRLVYARAFSAL